MFIFSISKGSSLNTRLDLRFHRWSLPPLTGTRPGDIPWQVSALSDALFSVVSHDPAGFLLQQYAPRSGEGPRQLLFSLSIRAGQHRVYLKRVSNGGCAAYFHCAPDGSFTVSSHLELFKQAGIGLRESAQSLPELLCYRHICAPRTMVDSVNQLMAGDEATVDCENGAWKLTRKQRFIPPVADARYSQGAKDAQLVTLMRKSLDAAIIKPEAQEEQLGCILSGGLDSSVITKSLKDHYNIKQTFSAAYPFEDASFDREFEYATSAAHSFGTRHTVYIPSMADYLHGTIDAVHLAEQPTMHLQTVLIHLLCKDVLAPRGVRVVPCGEGADGMFGGRLQRILTKFGDHPTLASLLRVPGVSTLLKAISRRTNRWGMLADISDKHWSAHTSFADPRHILWTLAVFGDKEWICEHLKCTRSDMISHRPEILAPYAQRDLRDTASILAFLSETSETQMIWNKIAQAHGMCFTYPYLDEQVVNLTYQTPWPAKLDGPKPLLRAVARQMGICEEIVSRPKASFDINPNKWGSRGSVFEPLIALALPVLDEQALRQLQSTYVLKAHTLWTQLNYAIWKRLFILGEPVEKLHNELDQALERLHLADLYRVKGRILTGGKPPSSL